MSQGTSLIRFCINFYLKRVAVNSIIFMWGLVNSLQGAILNRVEDLGFIASVPDYFVGILWMMWFKTVLSAGIPCFA